MALLTSITLASLTRLGYKVAISKKWLPAGFYSQLALDHLIKGKLSEASNFNRVALQKKPNHGRALIVRDLISMERDAQYEDVAKQQKYEQEQLCQLFQELDETRKRKKQDNFLLMLQRWLRALLLMLLVSSYIGLYVFWVFLDRPVLAGLLGGLAVTLTVLFVVGGRRLRESNLQREIRLQELDASQLALQQCLKIHQNNIRALKSKVIQLRYQTRTIR